MVKDSRPLRRAVVVGRRLSHLPPGEVLISEEPSVPLRLPQPWPLTSLPTRWYRRWTTTRWTVSKRETAVVAPCRARQRCPRLQRLCKVSSLGPHRKEPTRPGCEGCPFVACCLSSSRARRGRRVFLEPQLGAQASARTFRSSVAHISKRGEERGNRALARSAGGHLCDE